MKIYRLVIAGSLAASIGLAAALIHGALVSAPTDSTPSVGPSVYPPPASEQIGSPSTAAGYTPGTATPPPPGRPETVAPAQQPRTPASPRAPRTTASPPPVRQTDPDVVPSYRSCIDVRLDHPEGVETGHPAYRLSWDVNLNGWACDPDDGE
jgi:hypothetical protein